MPVTPESRLVRSPDCSSATVLDGLALLRVEQGTYFDVNSVGRAIWEMLAIPTSAVEICARLTSEYTVAPEQCLTEVLEFLSELHGKGLVEAHR